MKNNLRAVGTKLLSTSHTRISNKSLLLEIYFMKNALLQTILIIAPLSFAINAYSQSRSNIGFGYGINKPYSGDYNTGKGFQLQGNITITGSWSISPSLGYDRLLAKRQIINNSPYYYSNRIDNIDLTCLGVSARYSLNSNWFAKAGPVFYIAGGNEDIANLGFGGSAAVGYNLNFTPHSTLELSLSTEIINIPPQAGNGTTAIAGLKIAYVFNFRKL